jgi:hypothetical protein
MTQAALTLPAMRAAAEPPERARGAVRNGVNQ